MSTETAIYRASTETSAFDCVNWTRDSIRCLRLRLGWSQSDLARRLTCPVGEVEKFEAGEVAFNTNWKNELELIAKQADLCSEELQATPMMENIMDETSLEQVDFKDLIKDL